MRSRSLAKPLASACNSCYLGRCLPEIQVTYRPVQKRPTERGSEFMFDTIWSFLRDANNQQVLSWLGGGAVVFVGGAWAFFKFFLSHFVCKRALSWRESSLRCRFSAISIKVRSWASLSNTRASMVGQFSCGDAVSPAEYFIFGGVGVITTN
jgi:hypothetical protein